MANSNLASVIHSHIESPGHRNWLPECVHYLTVEVSNLFPDFGHQWESSPGIYFHWY